ncbi:MAG: hypothetical protein COW01_07880 [Bdellovibrionales bacterium CG12_big_fil_rev_8_21_14_0_65_38_15]|nr:MAG: hypothetical protein COW79_10910 [Bdellovibrionales bacterium CG22_combo_CG10-13_8_21_14_all_38_13]PIQ55289.1 MAG: hypothetical protein COW01_07880 [Bdellovibrionales bacterium CG12_big_fil_rev_8_21_14_0_65_38_15]PIR30793.1 MAG: hypothetical protein COV38_03685 [Bdellovibrionales bacterium CG11_big_fil_rev_8_21_14_0_20_38_13]
MKLFLASLLFLSSFYTYGLEIDEKLTVRLLRLSVSRKTVLLNRGLEDGLVVGDHAKFYLTTGVVARGVVQKVSPTRSIWSVYRIVDNDVLRADQILNLKISPPVKLTDDPSQSFIAQATKLDIETGIPLADGANDIVGSDLSEEEAGEFASMTTGDPAGKVMTRSSSPITENIPMNTSGEVVVRSGVGLSSTRTIELFGLAHFNALSTTSDLGTAGTTSGSDSSIDFSLGAEKYFNRSTGFLRDLSLFGFIHSASSSSSSAQGTEVSSSVFEYGAGLNYHFLAAPLSYHAMIGYVGVSLGIGTSEDTISDTTETAAEPVSLSGSANFFSLGAGIKYYLPNGFGMRAYLDYYRRGESFVIEDEEDEITKVVSGPRIQLGLSYRF